MILVTIIIPTFNRAAVLARAVASVRRQTFKNWELLVVDDGSTDETAERLQSWSDADFRLRAFHLPQNRGVSHARNFAAARAQGAWLAFLDSDDEWLPHKLERQMALTLSHEFIHGEEIWIRDGKRVNPMKKHAKSGGRIFSRSVDLCCISPSTTLISRRLFQEHGGFREDFPVCEDYELWLRLCARYDVGFVPDPVIIKHGGHADQLSRRFKAMDYFRVKALMPFVEAPDGLSPEERLHAAATAMKKCEILLNGYRKHGDSQNYAEVADWLERARRIFTQCQSAHSAAERLPLSNESLSP
ncbi:MAG: glycosyltransferase [Calothrix sp. SM1_5_4]|nr:glycosyltransferase [Calothrix sp. SM1_5_4]